MTEHAAEIVPLLMWMIIVIGAALIALILWVGKRLQKNVDDIPEMVSKKVQTLHDEILARMDSMAKTHRDLERDVRESITALDRRVVAVEVMCRINHKQTGV